ncbi:MAG: winged helix-turn-helix transcriptional regulator [Anaerolineales bacterium]|nr:winged helix-turn-helix transcriptional regulator [Anaerolineales bacterium]MCZ2123384.1 winged helix-turn-helix domain-containing protein [Anaerolineales bacterium]
MTMVALSGSDLLLETLSALANPHRLQIIKALVNETNYVSQLAREIGISRPLLIMHLKKLEDAGLVKSNLELSGDGKAMRYYEVVDFKLQITPVSIAKVMSK